MANRLVIRGAKVDPGPPESAADAHGSDFQRLYGDAVGYRVVERVVTSGARSTGSPVTLVTAEDDVLEIEDVDRVVTFHRASALTVEAERAAAREGAADGGLPYDLVQDVARGQNQGRVTEIRQTKLTLPTEIVADLEVLNQSLPEQVVTGVAGMVFEPAARAAMRRIAEWIDAPVSDDAAESLRRKRPKRPGLYTVGGDLLLEARNRLTEPAPSSPDQPYLLLVHGTFSHAEGAFGSLRDTREWRDLVRHYAGRILALEHPTLSRTPAENVLDVAGLLPQDTPLHLLSHSRGGLVGDVLSLGCAAADLDLAAYGARGVDPDHPDVKALPAAHRLLRDRGVSVRRFARVAAPARGTTLASRRLDRYATYLFNALRLMPGPVAPGMVELVQKFLLTLLDQRSDPRIVPGLEAQMPESPLVRLLNTAAPVDDGLGNLTGDIEGSGIARRLVVFGADLFYRADNDLVVNTGSMSGGVPRKNGRTRFFQGADVNHNAYFANEASRRAARDWLTARDGEVEGFVPGGIAESTSRTIRGRALSRDAGLDGRWPADKASNGIVVVIPDLLGSRFTVGGRAAWPDDVRRIATNGVEWLLTPPEEGSEATDLLPAYGPLVNTLRESFAVKPLPYDPRLPLADAVQELRDVLPQLLNKGRRRVHVVAHGYGCLVALGLRDAAHLQWQTLHRGGGRTVLLSPPLFGTWNARLRTAGQDELSGALALLHPEVSAQRIGELFAALPAYRDLMPPRDSDALAARTQELQQCDWAATYAVFGRSIRTPSLPTLPSSRQTEGDLPVPGPDDVLQPGDGHVTYQAAAVPGLTAWYAPVPFADLPSDPNTVADVVRLLEDRKPARLIGAPPPYSRPPRQSRTEPGASAPGASGEPGGPGPAPSLFPDSAELSRLALGAATPVEVPHEELHVSVIHGDVARMGGCVIVGTYDGTPIGGSEAALDRRLSGALTRHRVLGQYPGPPGTTQLVAHEGNDGLTVAVIGLGDPGDLTAGRLTTGVTQAALRLAARQLDIASAAVAAGAPPERIRLTLTTVLIGTTGTAAMPVSVALPAIVAGVRRANRRLADQRQLVEQLDIVIDGLSLVELYETRAADAVRAALELATTSSTEDGHLVVDSAVRDGLGGQTGSLQVTDRNTMWRTIRVGAAPGSRERKDDALVELAFTSVGRSARAEQRVSSGQREIIESLVSRCLNDPTVDRQLYNTLYELIVPNSLKGQGRESENIMFVLDDEAAKLPFEMLATRSYDEDDEPLAISVGMVRRLESTRFREGARLATGARALVIGDPPTTRFQRLPGAIREATVVADTLTAAGFEVTRLIPRDVHDETSVDPVRIMNALFEHDYRIVHVAAHGDYNPDDPARSGVVIGDRAFLTALEIQQMQTAPDLFFLNCCHLGSMTPANGAEPRQDWRPDRLAASISRELIDIGTRAVIAAGWAVDDEKATTFADTFYQRILGGDDLGTASLAARRAVYPRPDERQVNTWGAYQVYGPPALLLTTAGTDGGRDREPRSRGEFVEMLTRLGDRADQADGQTVHDLRRRLLDIEATAPPAWLDGPSFQALGTAYRNLGDHACSASAYERALATWGSAASLRTVDRLITAHTLWGVELARRPEVEHESKEHFARAESLLNGLDSLIGEQPPERISLRGGYYRRLLLCGGDVETALDSAYEAYSRASKLHKQNSGDIDPFTTLRAVALGWARSVRTGGKPVHNAREQVRQARRQAESVAYPDEWVRLAQIDADLVLALLSVVRKGTSGRSPTPAARAEELARAYGAQFEAGGSMRARRSVIENLEILLRCLPEGVDGRPPDDVQPAAVLLTRLKSALERWQPAALGSYSSGSGGYATRGNFLDS